MNLFNKSLFRFLYKQNSLSIPCYVLPFLVPPSTIEERQSNKTQLGFSHTAVQYTSECERTVDINGADTKWENSVQWNFRASCLPLTSIQPRLSSLPLERRHRLSLFFFLVCCFCYSLMQPGLVIPFIVREWSHIVISF